MHEYGLVDALIAAFLKTPTARSLPRVRRLRVRYGPGLTADSVRQAFQAQSPGTPLAGATLELERREEALRCPCGEPMSPFAPDHPDLEVAAQAHGRDHAHGHSHPREPAEHVHGLPYLDCPACGALVPIPHFDALEVVDAG